MKFRPTLPTIFKPIFWDTNYQRINPRVRKHYVIERVLATGRPSHIRWLLKTYPKRSIQAVARTSRALDPKSRNFWLTFLTGHHASRRSR